MQGIIHLQRCGMKRRKKEIRHMRAMAGLTVFFLVLTLIFQDNMEKYQMEMNYNRYGEWFLRKPQEDDFSHPFLSANGEIWTGGRIYKDVDGQTKGSLSERTTSPGKDSPEVLRITPEEGKNDTGVFLGMMDADAVKAGHIQLYDGHFPQKADEIVMELQVLQALGCNYDLGQEISFYVAEENDITKLIMNEEDLKLHCVKFKLAGTIKSYTTQWSGGEELPGALVSKDAFESLAMSKQGYSFLQIKQEYVTPGVSDFANQLWESIRKSKGGSGQESEEAMQSYAYNSFAYGNAFWGNTTMYRNMTIMLVVVGICIMAYLMSSYLAKRRKYYFQLREIGAAVWQIWKMICYECIYATIPAALASLVVSYLGSVLIVWGVARGAQIPFFYVFRLKSLVMVVGCVCLVLGVSLILAVLLFQTRRMTGERKKLSRLAWAGLRRRVRRKRRLRAAELSKRERMCRPAAVFFVRVLGILACLAVLCCMMQIYFHVNVYRYIRLELDDFTVDAGREKRIMKEQWIPVPEYIDENGEKMKKVYVGGSEEISSMKTLIPREVMTSIEEMAGVSGLRCSTRDQSHVFEWEGKGEDDYYKFKAENQCEVLPWNHVSDAAPAARKVVEQIDASLYESRYFEDCSVVWKDLKRHLNHRIADYDKLRRGEQVILFVDDFMDDEEGGFNAGRLERDKTLQEGDILSIVTKGGSVNVEIAGVLSAEEFLGKYGHCAYSIVGSGQLGRQIAQEDGLEYGYNHLEIDFNAFANAEATGKIITRLCSVHRLEYDSEMEQIRAYFQKIVQSILVYGVLAGIIFLLYLFVLSCILQEERRRRQPRRETLHRLGMAHRDMRRMDFANGLREGAALFAAVPLLYLIWTQRLVEEYKASSGTVGIHSNFFGKDIFDLTMGKYLFYRLLDYVNIGWWMTFMATAFVIVFCLHICSDKISAGWREN